MKKIYYLLSFLALVAVTSYVIIAKNTDSNKKDIEISQDTTQTVSKNKQDVGVNSAIQEEVVNAPILGNKDAKKTIFVYFDYVCPFSRRLFLELDQVLDTRNDVRVILKNFSIHGFLSDVPARAVIAAKIQSNKKAVKLHELLLTKEFETIIDLKYSAPSEEAMNFYVLKLAKQAGLDTDKLTEDMKGQTVKTELDNVHKLAQKFYISGTPTLIINGQVNGFTRAPEIIKKINM